MAACHPARKLPQGQYMLVKNKITIEHKTVDKDELKSYLRQKPNSKQLGTWIKVRIYNAASKGKETKVKKWFKNTLGSEPVVLDTNLTYSSTDQLRMYLNNKGFFNSEVSSKTIYLPRHRKNKAKQKRARVEYYIKTTTPFTLRNINYSIADAGLKAFVYSDRGQTLLRSGDQYDVDKLAAERDRIASNLSNYGYYRFSVAYIKFRIDSALNNHQLDLTVDITKPALPMENDPDSLVYTNHKRYHISNIYINTDYDPRGGDTVKYDTLRVQVPARRRKDPPKSYFFIYHDKLKIKPKTLTQQIFIDSGDYYCNKDVENTRKQLYELRVFRFVNIIFNDHTDLSDSSYQLDCQISLARRPVQAFALEGQITNSGGNLGVGGSLVYENLNLLHAAEIFNVKFNGAVEIGKLSFNTSKEDRALENIPLFNTIEAGINTSIKIPRFLLPIRQERFSKYFRPKTVIGAGFNFEQRPDYARYVTHISYGYEWKESLFKTHILTPWELDFVDMKPDSTFAAYIETLSNKITQNAYKSHINSAIKYSFILNTQELGKKENSMYFRGNFEAAGLLLWLYKSIEKDPGSYTLFDIPVSQYVRIDLDYRYFAFINEKNCIATRASFGIGTPLNKFNSLPFEKSFFLGGTNSMRGWRFKTLGPGSYDEPDSAHFDNTADMGIEMNIEYRFPIFKILTGGAFIDAGNIWLLKKNDVFSGGEFRFNRFYSEIAFDAGLGLRLDFTFLLFRLDWAVPLKDPRLPAGDRWVFQNHDKLKVLGNFGIGYPF
jgi:outer membrane protein assembly factor BamA